MTDDLYEPTPSKRLRSYDSYSTSPSFSELSCQEEKRSYGLRRKSKPLTPIKDRLGQRVSLAHESKDEKIKRRITRSSLVENEPKAEYPLIQLGSNLVVSIADSDSTRGTTELLVHILIDHNLCVPTKTDIITPNFSIVKSSEILDRHDEDISDTSYLNRHKKKELFEKKTKNRAKEIYKHELHSKMLRQESQQSIVSRSSGISFTDKSSDSYDPWYKNLTENKDQPMLRVGVFNGQELWGVDQDRLEELIKSKEIQSDYLPVNTPIKADVDHEGIPSRRSKSARKKVSK